MRINAFMGQAQDWRGIWDPNDEYRYRRAAGEKYRECIQIHSQLDDAKRAYNDAEGHDDALFEAYSTAVDRYNFCLDEYSFLLDVAEYGLHRSVPAAWQKFEYNPPEGEEPIPLEPNEPEEPEPPPVASVDWPPEIPKPTIEPIPPQEPELVEPQDCDPSKGEFYDPDTGQCHVSQPQVPSVDWTTVGCPPGTKRLVRGGACISPGLVSTGFPTATTTVPFTMSGRIPLSPGLGVRALGRAF